jgi:hypothetical protein
MAVRFDYAEAWRPDPGDILEGVVTEITTFDGGGYGPYPILTVRAEASENSAKAVHCFHTVLRNELARLDVQVGEQVAILYAGPQQTKDGTATYEGYRVKVPSRTPKKFDWGGDEGDPTSPDDLFSADTGDGGDVPF